MLVAEGKLEEADGCLPAGRRPWRPGRAGDAARPDRGSPGRARPDRPGVAPGRLGARPDVLDRVAWRRCAASRPRRSKPACAAWSGARSSSSTPIRARRSEASSASPRRSSAKSPTRPSPERDRRARHLAAARYFEALGRRRDGGRPGHPLPRCLSRVTRGRRRRARGGPGPDRAARGGRASDRARLARSGDRLPRAGVDSDLGPCRRGRAPRSRRCGRGGCGTLRRGRDRSSAGGRDRT